jgi:hypothetical protein
VLDAHQLTDGILVRNGKILEALSQNIKCEKSAGNVDSCHHGVPTGCVRSLCWSKKVAMVTILLVGLSMRCYERANNCK